MTERQHRAALASGHRWAGLRLLCALAAALLVLAWGPARAGSLDRAAVQALYPPPLLVGERPSGLPAWPIFRREAGALVLQAHVFETIDLEPLAGYGGKPANLLVELDADGRFRRVQLLAHGEPMFTSPQGTAVLQRFASQYEGLTLQHEIQVLSPQATRTVNDSSAALHGVMTGTVSATAIHRTLLESAAQVAAARLAADGASAPPRPRGPDDRYTRSGFQALVDAGLLRHWRLSNQQVQALFQGGAAALRDPQALAWPDGPALDAWIAPIGLPQAGRNLLDAASWQQVRALREAGDTLLLVIDGGRYPVQAAAEPGAARAALLALEQAGQRFTLQPVAGPLGLGPGGRHSGVARDAVARLFRVLPAAGGQRLDLAQPMVLALVLQRGASGLGATPVQAAASAAWTIPDAPRWQPQAEPPAWQAGWASRRTDVAVLAAALGLLAVALARQRWLSATPGRLQRFRLAWMLFTLGWLGWWAQGQLSIVSITSAIEAGLAGRSLDFLLMDPVALLLWAATGLSLLVWGRGSFCGWLCPFGALQELASRAAAALGLRARPLPRALDARLKRLKYAVLAALCGTAALAPAWTGAATEVEPFKTAISLLFQREWPWVLLALACVLASLRVFRAYCRYVCPLGALLALLGRLRRWNWVPRHADCGTPCQTCRHRCAWQAITPTGQVQYDECFQCLDCVQLHQNPRRCLPLLRAGRRVIPIGVAR